MGCVCLVVGRAWLVVCAARIKAGVEVVDNGLDDISCRGGDPMRIDLRLSDRENIWPVCTTTRTNEREYSLKLQIEKKLDQQAMTTRTGDQRMGTRALHMIQVGTCCTTRLVVMDVMIVGYPTRLLCAASFFAV